MSTEQSPRANSAPQPAKQPPAKQPAKQQPQPAQAPMAIPLALQNVTTARRAREYSAKQQAAFDAAAAAAQAFGTVTAPTDTPHMLHALADAGANGSYRARFFVAVGAQLLVVIDDNNGTTSNVSAYVVRDGQHALAYKSVKWSLTDTIKWLKAVGWLTDMQADSLPQFVRNERINKLIAAGIKAAK